MHYRSTPGSPTYLFFFIAILLPFLLSASRCVWIVIWLTVLFSILLRLSGLVIFVFFFCLRLKGAAILGFIVLLRLRGLLVVSVVSSFFAVPTCATSALVDGSSTKTSLLSSPST